jgi:hypothetical protein
MLLMHYHRGNSMACDPSYKQHLVVCHAIMFIVTFAADDICKGCQFESQSVTGYPEEAILRYSSVLQKIYLIIKISA